ncbi:hypothetical protein DFS33DRAFT_1124829 [Desarmillaria ectypa]|nr:hypothetical protein DFS33DRAFT_1124829 [Desarmillaria ectypa]
MAMMTRHPSTQLSASLHVHDFSSHPPCLASFLFPMPELSLLPPTTTRTQNTITHTAAGLLPNPTTPQGPQHLIIIPVPSRPLSPFSRQSILKFVLSLSILFPSHELDERFHLLKRTRTPSTSLTIDHSGHSIAVSKRAAQLLQRMGSPSSNTPSILME